MTLNMTDQPSCTSAWHFRRDIIVPEDGRFDAIDAARLLSYCPSIFTKL